MSTRGEHQPEPAEERFVSPLRVTPVSRAGAFSKTATGPVSYRVVVRDGVPLGYVWHDEGGGAAGWVPRKDAGDVGLNAGVSWARGLREQKAAGADSVQAVERLSEPGAITSSTGSSAGSEVRGIESVAELRALAARPSAST